MIMEHINLSCPEDNELLFKWHVASWRAQSKPIITCYSVVDEQQLNNWSISACPQFGLWQLGMYFIFSYWVGWVFFLNFAVLLSLLSFIANVNQNYLTGKISIPIKSLQKEKTSLLIWLTFNRLHNRQE
jgi:hypothetical protein